MNRLLSDSSQAASVSTVPTVYGNPLMPSLEDVLKHNGLVPDGALFLGQAEDDSPVLLDLHDPDPGPLMIVGREHSGKTLFLRSIARSIALTHRPNQILYGVVTDRVDEWQGLSRCDKHCVGVFNSSGPGARRFIQSLSIWRNCNTSNQPILLLVDSFDELIKWDQQMLVCLYEVISCGPQKRIWPIVTLHPEYYRQMGSRLGVFRQQFYEYGLALDGTAGLIQPPAETWDSPVYGPRFVLREKAGWIRFWIPSVSIQ